MVPAWIGFPDAPRRRRTGRSARRGGGQRLTASEFDAKAQAICAGYTQRAERELESVDIDPTSPKTSARDVARFARVIEHAATLFDEQLDDLRAIRPPAE